MPIHNLRRCLNTSNGYAMDLGGSLKGSTAWKWHGLNTCIRLDFSQLSQIWGSVCGCNNVSGKPYAHTQPEKVLKPII
jgi:hypothetical protein